MRLTISFNKDGNRDLEPPVFSDSALGYSYTGAVRLIALAFARNGMVAQQATNIPPALVTTCKAAWPSPVYTSPKGVNLDGIAVINARGDLVPFQIVRARVSFSGSAYRVQDPSYHEAFLVEPTPVKSFFDKFGSPGAGFNESAPNFSADIMIDNNTDRYVPIIPASIVTNAGQGTSDITVSQVFNSVIGGGSYDEDTPFGPVHRYGGRSNSWSAVFAPPAPVVGYRASIGVASPSPVLPMTYDAGNLRNNVRVGFRVATEYVIEIPSLSTLENGTVNQELWVLMGYVNLPATIFNPQGLPYYFASPGGYIDPAENNHILAFPINVKSPQSQMTGEVIGNVPACVVYGGSAAQAPGLAWNLLLSGRIYKGS